MITFALGMATAALSEAGIVFDIVAISELPAEDAVKPKWWIRPSRILVATEDASEARALVEPFQQPRSQSDLEGSSAQGLVDAVKPNRKDSARSISQLIWKGPPDAPFIQRAGARLIGSSFVCFGLFFLYETLKESTLVGALFSAGFVFLGFKVFLNGLIGNSK